MSDSYTERVRVWVGTFPSRRQYANYFCPPTNNPHGPPSQFEKDQGQLEGAWTWSEFRDEGPTSDLQAFINECSYRPDYCRSDVFLNQLCRAYVESGVGAVNTVYMASQNSLPHPKPVQGDRYQLHVLGEFTFSVPYALYDDDEEDEDEDEDEGEAEACVEVTARKKRIRPATAVAVAGDGKMDDARFWAMIERAWEAVPDGLALRGKLLTRRRMAWAEKLQFQFCPAVVALLEAALKTLNKRDLLAFDRILERHLHQLDRPEIHERTGGSNDGFLYGRGFIVTLGKQYYEMVDSNPSKALQDVECLEMCLCAVREYVDRYGESPPPSRISRASFSNKAHWK